MRLPKISRFRSPSEIVPEIPKTLSKTHPLIISTSSLFGSHETTDLSLIPGLRLNKHKSSPRTNSNSEFTSVAALVKKMSPKTVLSSVSSSIGLDQNFLDTVYPPALGVFSQEDVDRAKDAPLEQRLKMVMPWLKGECSVLIYSNRVNHRLNLGNKSLVVTWKAIAL